MSRFPAWDDSAFLGSIHGVSAGAGPQGFLGSFRKKHHVATHLFAKRTYVLRVTGIVTTRTKLWQGLRTLLPG